jgi:hypothetical protein
MSETKLEAKEVVTAIEKAARFLGLSSDAPETETTEEKKEAVEMAIEIPDGEYTLEGVGTITVVEGALGFMPAESEEAPEEEEASSEEELSKEVEKAELKEDTPKESEELKAALAKVEKLEAEVTKLSEAKPLNAAPKKSESEKPKIDLSRMSPQDRVMATIANIKKKK